MKTKIFFPTVAIFLLVFISATVFAGYEVELRNLEVTRNNVCEGETVRAEVQVEVECSESDATLFWYVDNNLVATDTIVFRGENRRTVSQSFRTKGMNPGTHDLKVVAKTACCEVDSLTASFNVNEPGELYDIQVANPRMSFQSVDRGCCGEDLKIETAVSVEEFDSVHPVGVKLKLFVYDNPERKGDYVYMDSRSVSVGSGSARTAVFWFNPGYLETGDYYVFVQATEKEGVCFNSFSEWSGYSVLEVGCDECSLVVDPDTQVIRVSDSGDDNGSDNGDSGTTTTQSGNGFEVPSLSKVIVVILVVAIVIVVVLIIFKLAQGAASESKRPV